MSKKIKTKFYSEDPLIKIQYNFKETRLFFILTLVLCSLKKKLQAYKSIRQLSNSDTGQIF